MTPQTEAESTSAVASGADRIAFVHIPKTAGGTVTTMFNTAYSKADVKNAGNYMSGADRTITKVKRGHVKGAKVTVGHVPYSVYRAQFGEDALYITFLREPVDRVLSHYYRHLHVVNARDPKRSQNRFEKGKLEPGAKAASIEEALGELEMVPIRNLMTRFLCDDPTPDTLPPEALDQAKENLSGFAFVGIQERFNLSLALLQRRLDLPVVPHGAPRHVGVDRPKVAEIPDEQRALIVEHNAMDVELYEHGVRLFDEAVAAAGEGLEEEAERVRELSAVVTEKERDTSLDVATEWLERQLPPGESRSKTPLLQAAQEAGIAPKHVQKAALIMRVKRVKRLWIRPPAGES